MEPSISLQTSLGKLVVGWRGEAICRVALVDPAQGGSEANAPRVVRRVAQQLCRFVEGGEEDLGQIPLAMDGGLSPFVRRVYEESRKLLRGETITYGELAARAGSPAASRAAGQVMAKNPFTLIVPCHRVLPSDGSLGQFSAFGGSTCKRTLLAREGVRLEADWSSVDALAHLRACDRQLAPWLDRVGPCGLRAQALRSVFDGLAESIVYQQLSGKAAATIWLRVLALFPPRGFTPQAVERMAQERLRSAGLSEAKTLALKDLAARAAAGALPERKQLQRWADSVIIDRLTEVRGIGPWTVQMLLLFRLGRPDVFPVADLGVQKGLGRVLGLKRLPNEREMLRAKERYAPYGSVAAWYLWRITELQD